MVALAFVFLLKASAEVSVLNCVSGEDTLDPAGYVAHTIEQWQAAADFAGVPFTGPPEFEIERFLHARTVLGRDLILIRANDRGRVIEVRSPGVACLIRTGEPRARGQR